MNVPIKMLGLTTSIFWALLIAFLVLAAYSVKDLSVDLGEPEYSVAPEGEMKIVLPLIVENMGYYSLKDIYISTICSEVNGSEISRSETIIPVLPRGETSTILHNMTLNPFFLLERSEQYLFNDSKLNVSLTAGINFAEIFPTEISTSLTFSWGAPFYNFTIHEPTFDRADFTNIIISAPISFANHAIFALEGYSRIELYDSQNSLISETQIMLFVPEHSFYEDNIEFSLPLTALSLSDVQSGHFDVYFDLGVFHYGPLVIPYG